MKNTLDGHVEEVASLLGLFDTKQVGAVVELLRRVRERRGMVWLFGNGGSAATAAHFANDLVKIAGVRAVPVPCFVPTVTAYGNDNGWERMYADALRVLVDSGDCLVGISCSGNSPNVVNALEYGAKRGRCATVGITAGDGGRVARMGLDCVIRVPVADITAQEDLHVMICHAIARALS